MPLRGWRWYAWLMAGRHGGREAARRFHELERSQWLDAQELRRCCEDKLRDQLVFAAAHVPHYGHLGPEPNLHAFPVLTRTTLQRNLRSLTSPLATARRSWRLNSSGSSGVVVSVLRDRQTQSWATACAWRGDCWGADLQPEMRQVSLLSNIGNIVGSRRALSPAGAWLHNRFVLDGMHLSVDRTRILLKQISELQPEVLSGYPSVLLVLARIGQLCGFSAPKLKKVLPTAETCSREEAQELELFFGAPVLQRYGSHEFSAMAHQCEHGSWHWHSEVLKVEVRAPDGSIRSEGRGSLLCTSLANQSFPLVRYEIGDEVDLTPVACPCGRGLPTFSTIEGRTKDYVYCPDGSWISAHAFLAVLRRLPLLQFQLIQEQPDMLHLLLVAEGVVPQPQLDWIAATFSEIHDGRLGLRILQVEELERSPGGKLLRMISRIPENLLSGGTPQ